MLITLMFLVVSMKSRTFFSFSYSADERELGGSTARQLAKAAMEIFHVIDVMLSLSMGVGQGGRNFSSSFP